MKNKKTNLQTVGLVLYSFFPIMPYGVLTIVNLIILSALIIPNHKNFCFRKKKFYHYTGFYLFFIVSLIYSNDVSEGLKNLQKTSLLFFFPFSCFFFRPQLSKKGLMIVLKSFVLVTFFFSLFILSLTYKELSQVGYDKLFYWSTLRRTMDSFPYLDLHPTYISLYLSMSIYILFFKNVFNKYLKVLVLSFMIFMLIILASRGVIISIFVGFTFYIFSILNISLNRKIFIFISLLLISYTISTKVFLISSRLTNLIEEISNSKPISIEEKSSSIEQRMAILYSVKPIIEENWFLGVGVGDFEQKLKESYIDLGYVYLSENNFNTHNYFLHIMGCTGIIGLFALVLFFFVEIKFFIVNKDGMFLMIYITFFVSLLFENVLSRAYGINLFCFFMMIFYLSSNLFGDRKIINT